MAQDETVEYIKYEGYIGVKSSAHPDFQDGVVKRWSQLTEVIRHFRTLSSESSQDDTQSFIERQIQLINAPKNVRVYTPYDLINAFSWRTRSRALYNSIRSQIKLPSISTLSKITRMSKNTDDITFFKQLFETLPDRSKGCILLIDEMYIKASVQYCGGELYGYAEDDKSKMAKTVLAVMVKCMFGGKKFLAKLVPVAALNSDFMFNVVRSVIEMIDECGGTVIAVVNDNNRVNQSFRKKFQAYNELAPWIVRSPANPRQPIFLLYDSTHILKNIRNNWIKESTQTLAFPVLGSTGEEKYYACWKNLDELYRHESESMLKLSKLTKAAVNPSNTQKQSVSLALQVFCDETRSALKESTESTSAWKETARFIAQVVTLWKLLNCKSPFQSVRLNDPDRAVVYDSSSTAKGILQEWADISVKMRPNNNCKENCLSYDTSCALEVTLRCFLDLCHYLCFTDKPWKHKYICLGFFQQDDLERHFGHFRTSAGSNYYLTAKEAFTTNALDRARIFLSLTPDMSTINDRHNCSLCDLPLSDQELLLLDDLTGDEMITAVSIDEKNALVYIAGYAAFKNPKFPDLRGNLPASEITAYFQERDRDGLCCPSELFVVFVLHTFCFFKHTESQMCRKRLTTIFSRFVRIFNLNITVPLKAIKCIANIFLKNFASHSNSNNFDSSAKRKTLKLSSSSNK